MNSKVGYNKPKRDEIVLWDLFVRESEAVWLLSLNTSVQCLNTEH